MKLSVTGVEIIHPSFPMLSSEHSPPGEIGIDIMVVVYWSAGQILIISNLTSAINIG